MGRFISFALILMIILSVSAALAEPVMLEYKYAVGETDKYIFDQDINITASGDMPGSSISMKSNMLYTENVLSVNPDGSARIQANYSSPTISGVKGKAALYKFGPANYIFTRSKDGKTTSIESLGNMISDVQKAQQLGMDLEKSLRASSSIIFFPSTPVEAGATWSQAVPLPFPNSSINVSNTLVSFGEQVWTQKAARIRQDFNCKIELSDIMKMVAQSMKELNSEQRARMTQIQGQTDYDGSITYLFSPAIGKLLKGTGSIASRFTMNFPKESARYGFPQNLYLDMSIVISITRTK